MKFGTNPGSPPNVAVSPLVGRLLATLLLLLLLLAPPPHAATPTTATAATTSPSTRLGTLIMEVFFLVMRAGSPPISTDCAILTKEIQTKRLVVVPIVTAVTIILHIAKRSCDMAHNTVPALKPLPSLQPHKTQRLT